MKKYFVFLSILFLPSCITDEVVTTVFRADGSFTRVVEFISDSKEWNPGDLATPVDSTWQVSILRDTADTSRYRVRLEKEYPGTARLNADYRGMSTTMQAVKREASFERKFMWFYTFYYYQETVYGLLTQRPLQDYLTDEEIGYLQGDEETLPPSLAGKDSAMISAFQEQVEDHFNAWMGNSLFDLWWAGMKKTVTDHPAGRFTPARLLAAGDTLRTLYLRAFHDLLPGKDFSRYFGEQFGVNPDTLVTRYPGVFKKYVEITESFVPWAAYENRVVMPGKVFDSNADRSVGEKLSWWVTAVRFLPGDMDMFAVSRKANYWAWLVAMFVIIFAVIMFLPRKKRE